MQEVIHDDKNFSENLHEKVDFLKVFAIMNVADSRKRREYPMEQKVAVLFMPDDIACTKEKIPLMLQPIMFCPCLTWMCAELMGSGIERFFIVSDVSAHELMKPYIPADAEVVFIDGAKHARELLPLLEKEEGEVLIVNGVVLPVGVFSVKSFALHCLR